MKNIAWKYEKEFRILATLPEGLENYPEKIEINANELWKNIIGLMSGPCMSE